MNQSTLTIDFAAFGGPVYCGRNKSEQFRADLDLDALDRSDRRALVIISDDTYTVSSSFFLGLFGKSILAAGSVSDFFQKFNFEASPYLIRSFQGYANNALISAAIRRNAP